MIQSTLVKITMSNFMLLLTFAVFSASNVRADIGFTAKTIDDKSISVSADATAKCHVVCFLGVECPMARIYGSRLSRMADDFKADVQFVGVDSNRQDSKDDIRKYVEGQGITFPFIQDVGNVIADRLGATRTPEVFVLDQNLKVQYHGRIDDQYGPGISRAQPGRQDLKIAIQELLAGKPVSVPETIATGCIIGKVKRDKTRPVVENDITYSQHVSRVLQKHCVECHRSGEIGPFAMDSFGEVVGWADTMLETIENGRMPPWHADPNHGKFHNSRLMPEKDKQILRDWIAGGLKEGDPANLPAVQKYVDGWQLQRAPDQVVAMRNRPFVVPKDGVVEYQYFVVDPGFTEDRWVEAAQVIPGARSVVHHAIVFVRPPDGARFRGVGWLSAYVPGQRMVPMPPGRARKVPAGSKLVFQMHYTPNGTETADVTKIGLLFADEKDVTHDVFTLVGIDQEFEIPPGAANHTVQAKLPWLPKEGELLGATPHMHYRGKSFRVFTDSDDKDPLLSVPRYDFNWQHTYALTEPVPLANLEELRFEATFDNSDGNPFNPDPSQWVSWGDQTWEEMAVVFFEISEPLVKSASDRNAAPTDNPSDSKANSEKIEAYVARCFEKMDANKDGVITRSEAPIVVRFFNFRIVDTNRDGTATREEVRKVAEDIYR